MEPGPNLIIHPRSELLLASSSNPTWVSEATFEAGLERLATAPMSGCLVHSSQLGNDGRSRIRAVRRVEPLLPIVVVGSDESPQMSAWRMGADGGG